MVSPDGFPGIGEYAFLSDCHTGALIAPDGAVEWLCLPRFDSPSVFGAILDRNAGSFRVGPASAKVPISRRYLPGTNVLETTWETESGWLVVLDALAVGPWREDRIDHHDRPPTDLDARHPADPAHRVHRGRGRGRGELPDDGLLRARPGRLEGRRRRPRRPDRDRRGALAPGSHRHARRRGRQQPRRSPLALAR